MADQNNGFDREDWRQNNEQARQTNENIRRTAEYERSRSEQLANQLSRQSLQQWQRSIEGLLALPTATALSIASTTLYVASFIERSFEVLQQSTEALRLGAEQGRREFLRAEDDDRSESRRLRERSEQRSDLNQQNRDQQAQA